MAFRMSLDAAMLPKAIEIFCRLNAVFVFLLSASAFCFLIFVVQHIASYFRAQYFVDF